MENVIFDFTPEFQMLISFLYPRLVWAAMSRGDQILFFEVWVHQQPQPSLKGFFNESEVGGKVCVREQNEVPRTLPHLGTTCQGKKY